MKAELSWIEAPWTGRLAILPRPRGGDWLEEEVRESRLAGVDVIVSLLTSDEIEELDLVQEARFARENGIHYLAFPIMDRGVPASRRATLELAKTLESLLQAGKTVAVHCRQGIGRSALIAACVLILAGVSPATAFQRLSAARGCPVPETAEQREWVIQFARELTPASA